MRITEDTPIPIGTLIVNREGEELTETIYYIVRSAHRRNGNSEKCIWTISREDEVNCFQDSRLQDWLEDTKGWGLKINAEGSLDEVGISDQGEILKIGKFRDDNSTREWHGYPADYCRRQQDKPSQRILMDWKNKGLINKTQMNRITQCKKCSL